MQSVLHGHLQSGSIWWWCSSSAGRWQMVTQEMPNSFKASMPGYCMAHRKSSRSRKGNARPILLVHYKYRGGSRSCFVPRQTNGEPLQTLDISMPFWKARWFHTEAGSIKKSSFHPSVCQSTHVFMHPCPMLQSLILRLNENLRKLIVDAEGFLKWRARQDTRARLNDPRSARVAVDKGGRPQTVVSARTLLKGSVPNERKVDGEVCQTESGMVKFAKGQFFSRQMSHWSHGVWNERTAQPSARHRPAVCKGQFIRIWHEFHRLGFWRQATVPSQWCPEGPKAGKCILVGLYHTKRFEDNTHNT